MVDSTTATTQKKLTPGDVRGVFLRSNLFQGSWNFERMQALILLLNGSGYPPPVS